MLKLLLVTCSLVALTGCSSKPPNCSSPETHKLIRSILYDKYKVMTEPKLDDSDLKKIFLISDSSTEDYAENVKRWTCSATLTTTTENIPEILVKGEFKQNLKYESKLDDEKNHLVKLQIIGNIPKNITGLILSTKQLSLAEERKK